MLEGRQRLRRSAWLPPVDLAHCAPRVRTQLWQVPQAVPWCRQVSGSCTRAACGASGAEEHGRNCALLEGLDSSMYNETNMAMGGLRQWQGRTHAVLAARHDDVGIARLHHQLLDTVVVVPAHPGHAITSPGVCQCCARFSGLAALDDAYPQHATTTACFISLLTERTSVSCSQIAALTGS